MDLRAAVDLSCSAEIAQADLRVLDHYPEWLGIVTQVQAAPAEPRDPGPAWVVELGGGVGPVRLRKRVRMVRTTDTPAAVRFERRDDDGEEHHAWVLEITIQAPGPQNPTHVDLHLHYGGTLPPLVDRLLGVEVGRAGPRLRRRLAAIS
jgi:hypothetical protein